MLRYRLLIISILLNLLAIEISVLAQNSEVGQTNQYVFTNGSADSSFFDTSKGHSTNSIMYDPFEEKVYIVELSIEPISILKQNKAATKAQISARLAAIEMEQKKFILDLQNITKDSPVNLLGSIESYESKILASYKTVINGIAVRTQARLAEKIERLDNVQRIGVDQKYHIDVTESTQLIGADSVWINYGFTGAGVVIGIIDTGIDYLHPDLGGGIGPDYKVLGGYDFVNNDSDPMDDEGHGTHVAGIAAANGVIKGVAPDAKLMAIKAFDDTGWGRWWHILSAFEYALDPDNNPLTNDGVNIINMSWGSQENTYDETISNAVKNLENTGIIFVASAGNRGPNYRTINSPAIVTHVIAVGNTTKADSINDGSSRGPAIFNLSIKPDLVAPGTNIISTNKNGGYVSMTGSSMATPMVSGAAALLLQKYPDWSPELIKSKLKNSASNIGYDPYTQGAGKIDIFNAVKSETVAYPSSINLGIIEGDSNNFSSLNKIIDFYNSGNDTVHYSTSCNNSTGNGLNIIINNPSGIVNPNSSIQLYITFNFDLTLIPCLDLSNPNWIPYTGSIKIYSNIDTCEVSYSFIKHSYIKIISSSGPGTSGDIQYLVYSVEGDKQQTSFTLDNDIYFLVNPGVYNAYQYSLNSSSISAVENINVINSETVYLETSDATNILSLDFRDALGDPISFTNSSQVTTELIFNDSIVLITAPLSKLSILSRSHKLRYVAWNDINSINRFIFKDLIYVDTSLLITKYANNTNKFSIDYSNISDSLIQLDQYFNWYLEGWAIANQYNSQLNTHNKQSLYYEGEIYDSKNWPYYMYSRIRSSENYFPDIRRRDSILEFYFYFDDTKPILKYSGNTIKYNLGPSHFFGKFINSDTSIIIGTNAHEIGYGSKYFLRQFQDYQDGNYQFTIIDSMLDSIHTGDLIANTANFPFGTFFTYDYATPNYYEITIIDTTSVVFNIPSRTIVKAGFDLSKNDRNPPAITSFNVAVDNEFQDFVSSENNTILVKIVANDNENISQSLFYIQYENDSSWHQVEVSIQDSLYIADLSDIVPQNFVGYFNFKTKFIDNSGNFLEQLNRPGLKVGDNELFYNITASAGSGGNISPSGNIYVTHGNSITFTITPNYGQAIANVLVDGISVGNVSSYTISNVITNHTIFASFSDCLKPDNAGEISGSTIVCQGENFVVYTVPAIANVTTYVWTLPAGASGNSTTNSITVNFGAEASSGEISVKGLNDCGEGEASSMFVQVHELPAQPSPISGNVAPLIGSSEVYSVTSIEGINYDWTVPEGSSIIEGQGTNMVTVIAGGNAGTITVTPSNACGTGMPSFLEIQAACNSSWSPLPNLQFNMQIVAQILIDGQVSLNPNDVLGAFVGDECRGIASPDPALNGIVFLTVGSNVASGEQIELKIWNSNECSDCNAIPGFEFVNQGEIGNFLEPYQLRCGAIQDISFGQGYTWFSLNVNPGSMTPASLFTDLTPCYDDRVIGQTSFALFTGSTWVGSLTNLGMDKMYRMKLCSQQSMSLMGDAAPLIPISLSNGYTWLGYSPQECLPINQALANMTPAPAYDDRLIGQSSFALFTGSQWVGTLTTLCPDAGYVIRLANASTLRWPNNVPAPVAAFTADITEGIAPLTVNFSDQSSNNPTSWLWDFGDGTTGTTQNPAHTYQTAGSFTVQLTVSNGSGGSDTEAKANYITVTENTLWPPGTVHCSGTPTAIVDVTNPITGKTWMDRNLGAAQAATSSTDELAYGDLYQWGRFADGHQCRNSANTTTLSSTDMPGHGDFILVNGGNWDWRSPQNPSLWQGISGTNNPCPIGYRLPTEYEWETERQSWSTNNDAGAFESTLKLPVAGTRDYSEGYLGNVGTSGIYWSSNIAGSTYSRQHYFYIFDAGMSGNYRAYGSSIRCIKGESTLYNLNLEVNPTDAASVTGAGAYQSGTTVTITATPNQGWEFVNWTGDVAYLDNPNAATAIVNMPEASVSLTANFQEETGLWPPGTVHCTGTPTAIVDVTNPVTGKTWMDRNLGASQAATSSTDELAYGDLYQWGRFSDGHQCRNSGTTTTLSSTDMPGHGDFILAPNSPYDWRSPQNDNLWQGVNGTNNPCPSGYRLPTDAELNTERTSWSSNNAAGAYASPLKLPVAGFRNRSNGSLYSVGSNGLYWSATVDGTRARYLSFDSSDAFVYSYGRAFGFSVRCIKDTPEPTLYNLNIEVNPSNTGNVNGAGDYLAGTAVTITATPNQGWEFVSWTGDVAYLDNPGSATATVTMPEANVSLTANFQEETGLWPPGTVHCTGTPTAIVDVTNPITGKTWMDRNLGASQAATSSTDELAYGDLYQWGRFSDWHQCRSSTTTNTLSITDIPGHGNFITVNSSPWDWRNPQNNNLWQGVNGTNNPCPSGYRLPTDAELNTELTSWSSNNAAGAYASPLKLAVAGFRYGSLGSLGGVGSRGNYWSATVGGTLARTLYFVSSNAYMYSNDRAGGYSVRCLRDAAQPTSYNLNIEVNPSNGGSVTGAGNYQAGTAVTITATPNQGWEFVNWTGDVAYLDNPNTASATVTMPEANVSLIANFVEDPSGFACGDNFIDPRDGNEYTTVLIGDQCWMKENLKYLPEVVGAATGSETEPYHYVYDYEGTDVNAAKATANYQNYGALYNYPASLTACPTGWHLPSDAEWWELTYYAVSQGYPNNNVTNGAGSALKSCRQVNSSLGGVCNTTEHPRWELENLPYQGFDAFGFSALPGGIRHQNGYFSSFGFIGEWWSSTDYLSAMALGRGLGFYFGFVGRSGSSKETGVSVRCIRD